MDFEQAVEDWKAHDQWEFADKQAAWGFFFMAGRESKQRENEMDPHIDGVVPVQMTDAERGFLNGMLIGNLRRIYAAHDDEGNDLSALPSRAADEIERLQGLPETIEAMDKAMNDWTDKAARGECGWICSDCCCSFPEGMPDECAHGHQKCTDIIQRDKAMARGEVTPNALANAPASAGD